MDKAIHSQNQTTLQDLLRELRKEADLRQQDVAKKINEPQSFVSKYESGERRLDILELRELCRVFKLSLVEFSEQLEQRLSK
ncbi:MAG TPA: transcriptional regulator [Planctomycetaceae bacterium]|nr:transcriptional regulator [Planctomycetaceae bacterium]